MEIRKGAATDAEEIAALHTESWRTAYAGIMPAPYLDGPLREEHRALWRSRLGGPAGSGDCLLVAQGHDGIDGFAYLFPQPDGRVFLDNLHVRPALKRSGIGSRLTRRAFAWAGADHPGREFYLEVLRDNAPARAFYKRMGGVPGREFTETAGEDVELAVIEYSWSAAAVATASS